MVGIGTIINAISVLLGGGIGLLLGNRLPESIQKILTQAMGLSVLFISVAGAMSHMLVLTDKALLTKGGMLITISLALGAILGEWIDIERHIVLFGEKIKQKVGNTQDNLFVEGFVTASFTICIGAMAIVGSIQDGLLHDPTMLFTKSVLDGVILIVFASVYGIGAIFSIIPLVLWQGIITLCSSLVQQFLTPTMIDSISLVGSLLIFCVGANLFFNMKIKVANLLPSLIFAIILVHVIG
ncbi:DUF554 domain-containing protein [Carnobacteriaceae bacterium zg-84]|uniref:DUF554 domain-containing protein n=1 Tax=Granulicatella sp. zg-84 TaxID=2678503 RepID=UPI0013BEE83F|nr:DUF554 domain-containing protein [Granulicatella sp. zg-84]NEW66777.1 DUF554 family protein [Granulicatella sp. zg-84]QMI85353.1 DUF554 domain-containing protein [Carnobacteriaceae bacterium zg-84]